MTATLSERSAAARADELELAGLLLATLPRLLKMAMSASEQSPMSANRAGLMWQLRERPMRSGELAQRCVMTAPALTEQVDSLVRDGFVRRLEDPTDRRVVLVELSARGRRELDRYREYMKERVARVLANLPPDKRARLRSALSDLRDGIEAMTKESTTAR
ncbi:MAG TPA: MarR family transcriptional regulator [Candidatus Limnocylindria bacterium]|jgi:DNA-binding MarR family transcriptional regulator|nr:MarR family transcriptional regulator [Candidatus Limnocylindria bacterium]